MALCCVCSFVKNFMPAARTGLWSWVFVCPAACNWADRALEAATAQTGCMRPAVGASMLYVCTYTYFH